MNSEVLPSLAAFQDNRRLILEDIERARHFAHALVFFSVAMSDREDGDSIEVMAEQVVESLDSAKLMLAEMLSVPIKVL